jgi:hypothetical protein
VAPPTRDGVARRGAQRRGQGAPAPGRSSPPMDDSCAVSSRHCCTHCPPSRPFALSTSFSLLPSHILPPTLSSWSEAYSPENTTAPAALVSTRSSTHATLVPPVSHFETLAVYGFQLVQGKQEIPGGCPKYSNGRRSSGMVVEEEEVPSARALSTALSPRHANDRRRVTFRFHLRRRVPSASLGPTCTGDVSNAATERGGRSRSSEVEDGRAVRTHGSTTPSELAQSS